MLEVRAIAMAEPPPMKGHNVMSTVVDFSVLDLPEPRLWRIPRHTRALLCNGTSARPPARPTGCNEQTASASITHRHQVLRRSCPVPNVVDELPDVPVEANRPSNGSSASWTNLYRGHQPTFQMAPHVPRDGYLADFLMRNKGFIRH
jgi:hypothetical protein